MAGHGDQLPPRLGHAVQVYLRRLPHAAAAQALGISRTTFWRWRRRPEFRLAVLMEWRRQRELAA